MYLLDTSAWLVHLFAEAGVEQVNQCFEQRRDAVFIASPSLLEVFSRLKAIGHAGDWEQVWWVYQRLFTRVLPVDQAVAQRAILLRADTSERIPAIDGLIAAVALVHRDPHFDSISPDNLRQLKLPEQ